MTLLQEWLHREYDRELFEYRHSMGSWYDSHVVVDGTRVIQVRRRQFPDKPADYWQEVGRFPLGRLPEGQAVVQVPAQMAEDRPEPHPRYPVNAAGHVAYLMSAEAAREVLGVIAEWRETAQQGRELLAGYRDRLVTAG